MLTLDNFLLRLEKKLLVINFSYLIYQSILFILCITSKTSRFQNTYIKHVLLSNLRKNKFKVRKILELKDQNYFIK